VAADITNEVVPPLLVVLTILAFSFASFFGARLSSPFLSFSTVFSCFFILLASFFSAFVVVISFATDVSTSFSTSPMIDESSSPHNSLATLV
jgi:amino acid transporter